MKRIKIFIFGSIRSLAEEMGGAGKSVLLLAGSLAASGNRVQLIAFGSENRETELLLEGVNVPAKECKVSKLGSFLMIPWMPLFYRIIKREAAEEDILHFYNVKLDPVAGLYKALNPSMKVLSTLTNYYYISPNFECSLSGLPRYRYSFAAKIKAYYELAKQNVGRLASAFLWPVFPIMALLCGLNVHLSKKIGKYAALSDTVKMIYEINEFSGISVIPNMYDPSFFGQRDLPKKKHILYAGRIKISKGVGNLIRAFNSSGLVSEGYVLRIAGAGNQLEFLKKKYTQKHIFFLGNIARKELKKEYCEAEIFVYPGIRPEPFGRSILEAIQCGCKILVSDIGEPSNIVNKPECIYKHGDIEELCQKLVDIAKNKDTGKIEKDILEKYAPDRIREMYEKLYREM